MTCDEIREKMPDWAAGRMAATGEESRHLASCAACSGKLEAFRHTMALLDEWQAPQPSPYFDVRLQARLREEMAKPQAGFFQWFRRPVLAAALTVLLGAGVGVFLTQGRGILHAGPDQPVADNFGPVEPGTAVSDLQALDRNNELYADFELLDDLQVQDDVTANP